MNAQVTKLGARVRRAKGLTKRAGAGGRAPSVRLPDTSPALTPQWPAPDTNEATKPPIVRMQHHVILANANLSDLEKMIEEHPADLNSAGLLTELSGIRDKLGAMFNELWNAMVKQYDL